MRTFYRMLALIFFVFTTPATLALSLNIDKSDFQFDVSRVEVLSAAEALKKLGPYYFNRNEKFRYLDADEAQKASAFEVTGGCQLGNCIPGHIRYDLSLSAYGTYPVIEWYAGKAYLNTLVGILNTCLEAAKTNKYGLLLSVDSISAPEIFFIK
ncbi:MAG: hypothetical protein AB7G93_11085 [Bdellovibrionales bacterium]